MITCKNEKNQDHDHHVPKVQNGTCNAHDLKFFKEVMNCIHEKINSCKTASKKRLSTINDNPAKKVKKTNFLDEILTTNELAIIVITILIRLCKIID